MNQLSEFYCFIILYHINTQHTAARPPTSTHSRAYTHTHTHTHTRGRGSTHRHRSVDTQATTALISDCLDDRCVFITRHQSILFGDQLNVFLAGLPLNYSRNEGENKHPDKILTFEDVCSVNSLKLWGVLILVSRIEFKFF